MKIEKVQGFQNKHTEKVLSFGSENIPVKSFKISLPTEDIFVRELTREDAKAAGLLRELSSFFVKNFAESSTNPVWKMVLNDSGRLEYNINENAKDYKQFLEHNDGNTTILIAENRKGEIKGSIIAGSYNEFVNWVDSKTGHINSIAISKDLRNQKLGEILLDKAESTGRPFFSDYILEAYAKAVPFYKKHGYETPSWINLKSYTIVNNILMQRMESSKHIKVMSKIINKEMPRWYDRMYTILKNSHIR